VPTTSATRSCHPCPCVRGLRFGNRAELVAVGQPRRRIHGRAAIGESEFKAMGMSESRGQLIFRPCRVGCRIDGWREERRVGVRTHLRTGERPSLAVKASRHTGAELPSVAD